MKISVVIVKYHSESYLDACIKSVKQEKPYEIIIVDNDKENRGYGGGCNFGAKKATGDILLFLNPDTRLVPGCVKVIVNYFEKYSRVGVIGPKLYTDDNKKTVQLSCCRKSDLFTSLIVYGKIQHWFTVNRWWNSFTYQCRLSADQPFCVDVVSGAALAIKKPVFDQVGGFDSNIFLFFEENDLCLRVKNAGYLNSYLPTAEVIHYGGGSMKGFSARDRLYKESRRYYFSKHYPRYQATIINMLLK